MRKTVVVAFIAALALGASACKSESGEEDAGCEGKQSTVVAKELNADNHFMLTLSCGSDFNWYVTWDDPNDKDAYDSYNIGDVYS